MDKATQVAHSSIDCGMPVYEPDSSLLRAVDSIKSQTLLPDNVFIRDDASITPRAHEVLGRLNAPHLSVRTNKKNIGMFKNFFSVLQDSRNEYFIFLAQDDYWMPNHLESLREVLAKNPSAVVAISGIDLHVEGSVIASYLPTPVPGTNIMSKFKVIHHFFQGKRLNNSIYYGLWRRERLSTIFDHMLRYGLENNEKLTVALGFLSGDIACVENKSFIKSHARRKSQSGLGFGLSNSKYFLKLVRIFTKYTRCLAVYPYGGAVFKAIIITYSLFSTLKKLFFRNVSDILRAFTR